MEEETLREVATQWPTVDLASLDDDHVEAKLHGESKVIQRCFDDNNDDNKR